MAWYRARTAAGVTGYVKSFKAVPYAAGGNGYEEAIVAVSSAVIRDTNKTIGTLVHEPPQGARLTLRSFTKTDDDGNAWKYASVSYGDGTEYSGYIMEQALMYVAANQVYATASEAKTVYKGPATTAAVMDTIDANEDVQVRGVVYRNNGTTWYGVHTGSTMGFIKSDNKVTLSDDLVYTRTHTEVVNDTVARKQFSHVRPQPAARAAIRCMRSLWQSAICQKTEAAANIQV